MTLSKIAFQKYLELKYYNYGPAGGGGGGQGGPELVFVSHCLYGVPTVAGMLLKPGIAEFVIWLMTWPFRSSWQASALVTYV